MRHFAYARSLAPMIWALVALSFVELSLVHLLVALLWSRWVALALSLASLAGIVWLVRLVRSFARLPVEVGEGRVVMRAGSLKQITLAAGDIAGLRSSFDAQAIKAPGMLKLSLIAFPNVVLDLARPVMLGRRRVSAVAHRLDDPAGFAIAIGNLTGRA